MEPEESLHRTRLRTGQEAAAAAESARWLALSPAQRCFSDGLAIAFSHLTLAELMTAARCCKSWYEAAKRVKSLGAGQDSLHHVTRAFKTVDRCISVSAAPRLVNFASSPFRHLIRQLIDWSKPDEDREAEDDDDDLSEWQLADLRLLRHLPHLTNIEGMFIVLPCTA